VLIDEGKREKYDLYGEKGKPEGGMGGFFNRKEGKEGVKRGRTVRHALNVSLEEMFTGTTKTLNLTRQVMRGPAGDKVKKENRSIQVDIAPGTRHGHEIKKMNEGDEKRGVAAGDVVFVVHQKPHSTFTRDGCNLTMTHDVQLVDALCGGCKIAVRQLDGRQLLLTTKENEVLRPDMSMMVHGEGMPIRGDRSERGVLIVEFNIIFPSTPFTAAERQVLSCALPAASNPGSTAEVESVSIDDMPDEMIAERKRVDEEPDYPRRPQFRPEDLDEEVECNQQ
jgi:DnaJ-class molecular chaperone